MEIHSPGLALSIKAEWNQEWDLVHPKGWSTQKAGFILGPPKRLAAFLKFSQTAIGTEGYTKYRGHSSTYVAHDDQGFGRALSICYANILYGVWEEFFCGCLVWNAE